MSVVNLPKTRASRDTVPVIPALAGILDEYRRSMGNPEVGVIFHSGSRLPINVNNLARRVIRPALEAVDLPWYGWHAFRRGLASNLYEMGAPDKVVQRCNASCATRNRTLRRNATLRCLIARCSKRWRRCRHGSKNSDKQKAAVNSWNWNLATALANR